MTQLRIVGFASGSPLSIAVMTQLARKGQLAAIVAPASKPPLRARVSALLRPGANPLARLGVPVIESSDLARHAPDLVVIASFPAILPARTLALPRRGALNIHLGLLPRHRGIDPIFWTYFDDDREAGVTVHWVSRGVDDGDIADQRAVNLERGRPSRALYFELADIGVSLVDGVINDILDGRERRVPQNAAGATHETKADIERAVVPFAQWPAERVWHALSGLGDQWHTLLADANGVRLPHGRATNYEHCQSIPGQIEQIEKTLTLHCADGLVVVERFGG